MTWETIMKFRTLFEEEKRKLVYSQGVISNENFYLKSDDLLDDLDMTTSELETSMRRRLRNREVLFLKKIDEALRRIAGGTFGQCECCQDEIEMKRLEARPTTTLCLSCKEEQEHKESAHIDGRKSKSLGARPRVRWV